MSDLRSAVFGIYKTRSQVETAIRDLRAGGLNPSDISILSPGEGGHDLMPGDPATDLSVPGVGRLLAAGPLASFFEGHDRAAGLISEVLMDAGVSEYEARRFEGHVKDGELLLTVYADSPEMLQKARLTFEKSSAEDTTQTHF